MTMLLSKVVILQITEVTKIMRFFGNLAFDKFRVRSRS